VTGTPLVYAPPSYNTQNVVYGVGIVMTATVGTGLPTPDATLGLGSAWTGIGWSYVGCTDAGVSVTWNPTTVDISIEEQPTPVAVIVDKATAQVTFDFSEETLTNINLAYGGAGTITPTSAGAGQPGKNVLTLSTNFPQLACAVISKNQLGFARVMSIPAIMSTGQVKTDYRRSANQRLYPTTFNTVCPFNQISWVDLTSVATS
jgi:hypothetical protein